MRLSTKVSLLGAILVMAVFPQSVSIPTNPGTISSIVFTQTDNQITITGCSMVTTTGTCTFSLPSTLIAPGSVATTSSGYIQSAGRSVDPTCSVAGDIGKFWVDNSSAVTTHMKVCGNVSSSPAWVQVF